MSRWTGARMTRTTAMRWPGPSHCVSMIFTDFAPPAGLKRFSMRRANFRLAHASPAVATSYAFVNPVIALLLGVFIAGEVVSGAEWIACGIILAGVLLIFRGKTGSISQ